MPQLDLGSILACHRSRAQPGHRCQLQQSSGDIPQKFFLQYLTFVCFSSSDAGSTYETPRWPVRQLETSLVLLAQERIQGGRSHPKLQTLNRYLVSSVFSQLLGVWNLQRVDLEDGHVATLLRADFPTAAPLVCVAHSCPAP